MVTVPSRDGGEFEAYLAEPKGRQGPGIVLIQEIFGVNQTMRDLADWFAQYGFAVICPDLFWRQEPGVRLSDQSEGDWQRALALYEALDERKAVDDVADAAALLRDHQVCSGAVGAVGYCLGGKLSYLLAARYAPDCAVGYYGVGIEKSLEEANHIRSPLMLHLAGADEYCDRAAQVLIREQLERNTKVTLHDYPEQAHAFARPGAPHFDIAAAELANLRTLAFLQEHLAGASGARATVAKPDFAELWAEHIKYEFETHNAEDTLETMVDDAYVNHIPTLTGGVGKEQLLEFYSQRFIPQMPPDTEMTPVSRTVGSDRLVDEMIFKFTHTIEMDWMLPGISPTGRKVEVPLVAIVHFRDNKLAHEHIYWDQASVLVQLGLLDTAELPIAGVESAQKVLDNTVPSNSLIERADRWKRQGRT